jgi:peptide/nickel transport system ATP-binding protein
MIELANLTASFDGAAALRDATLSVAPGDRLGVVGESGSGKTLFALCLMGMAPDAANLSGSIHVDGQDMSVASESDWQAIRARRVAMVFQEPMAALNPLRRVGVTVAEPLMVHEGISRQAALARALALFKEVGINEPEARLRQFPHQLSGGQRQRVLIALALACNPALLIADEPTTALDASVALRITDLLVRLAKERQMALIFISHDLATVARATNEIMVMYGGDIVERGPTTDVLETPIHPYTKGLLAALPKWLIAQRDAEGKRSRLATIPGSVPPLPELPQGCRFAGRCQNELANCATERPALQQKSVGRSAACHLLDRDAS